MDFEKPGATLVQDMNKSILGRNVAGVDISLNHVGWVILSARLDQPWGRKVIKKQGFVTLDKGFWVHPQNLLDAKHSQKLLELKNFYRLGNKMAWQIARLFVWTKYCKALAFQFVEADVRAVAIEQYAYGAKSQSLYQIGEVGGALRTTFLEKGLTLHFVISTTVKKWACGGRADKKQMIAAARDAGFQISQGLVKGIIKGSEDLVGPGTDLADAYWMADLLVTKLMVNEGLDIPTNLAEHKREVLTSKTKKSPTRFLDTKSITYDPLWIAPTAKKVVKE